MRIAIDAQELTGKVTGVGRYLSQILQAWSRMPEARAHELVLCAPEQPDPALLEELRVSVATAPGRGSAWQQTALPRLAARAKADVLFAPAYSGPIFSRIPMVVSIHDVSYFAHPSWFGWREGLRRRTLTRFSARRARRILTFSEFSKTEIVRYVHVDPAIVDVTYHGVTTLTTRATGTERSAAAGDDDPVVLYVGSIFNRRHLPELIEAFGQMRHPRARLEIVGENRTRPHIDLAAHVAASGAADRIRLHSWLPDDELAKLYRRARAFVFLSSYEGFGMTPLEAMAAGVPPVVLDTSVAREVYGPAALYVERPDAASVRRCLEQVLGDAATRARLADAASSVLVRYSWQTCAERTLHSLVAAGS